MDSCSNCRFSLDVDDSRLAYCRRQPPVVVSQDVSSRASHWPEVFPNEWCGEWKPGKTREVLARTDQAGTAAESFWEIAEKAMQRVKRWPKWKRRAATSAQTGEGE